MDWLGNCRTTAMGIMPHNRVDEALTLALTLDIPFWPQLPKVSFFEDMYVQASEHFPGITLDVANQRINFSTEAFYEDLPEYLEHMNQPEFFTLNQKYSMVYSRFLAEDLHSFPAIRGQLIGPVSFGMKIHDENLKPIIYNNEVKGLLYEFIAKKINAQYAELKSRNPHAYMWVDEPGLEIIFGSFTGYASETAREDYRQFLQMLDAPIGIHLCGNPDWSFLLQQDISILSLDAFTCGHIFSRYADEVHDFLRQGKFIAWGIVPTLTEELAGLDADDLISRLNNLWDYLESKGVARELILKQSLLAPSRCCLLNADGTKTIETSFSLLQAISQNIRKTYGLT